MLAKEVRKKIELGRNRIATCLHCESSEIIFTSGGTESDNLAILGYLHSKNVKCGHIITTQIEHSAVLNTCQYLEKNGYNVTYLRVGSNGIVDPDDVVSAIRTDTILISIMLVNNETGTIQPIRKIAEIAKEHGITIHTDAVQAIGKIHVDVHSLGVDLLSFTAHKFHGPKGTGGLFIRSGTPVKSLMIGGHQEQSVRPGTENVPGILGMAKAIKLACNDIDGKNLQMSNYRNTLETRILSYLPDTVINGDRKNRVSSVSNLSFKHVDSIIFHKFLHREGLCITSGSACESDSLAPSHVLTSMGLNAELAEAAVRFSLSAETTEKEIIECIEIVCKVVKQLRVTC